MRHEALAPHCLGDEAVGVDDLDRHIFRHQHKGLLRFIACGSVDDGKSTLIGRLLCDAKMVLEDELAALEAQSARTTGGDRPIDFAMLVDGLAAEREQGITIDVAYRFFTTAERKFIVVDAPGHEQYTRNMITGASKAELAVILIDARKGVLGQTRRHAYLCRLIGIRHFVLAVNKMDLIGYDQARFRKMVDEFRVFAERVGIDNVQPIPVSSLKGDNIFGARSANMRWYEGPTLMDHLERVELDVTAGQAKPFRMPVQWVNRARGDFRGFSGLISSGVVRRGDMVRILPSAKVSKVDRIVLAGTDLDRAVAGQSVTLTLTDELDCSRGDVISVADDPPEVADQFEAVIVWMSDQALLPGRAYWLKLGAQTVTAKVQALKYQVNVDTLEHVAAKTLQLNAIGVATLSTDRPVVFEPYAKDRSLGGFIVIDKQSNATVAAGMLHFALRRSRNIHWQAMALRREDRAELMNQRPAVLWFTGLSGAGKSTIANLVEVKLRRMNRHTFLLDGDNIRHGLNKDLGFTDADRVENIRRVGEVARLMTDAGLIVIAAFISPFQAERDMVRGLMEPGEFNEIFVDTPLAAAEARDVKGLYKKARSGQLKNFTGIDSPYEPPIDPELRIDTTGVSPAEAADLVVQLLIP
jgi:bifunctional enzyme CysN/CysC